MFQKAELMENFLSTPSKSDIGLFFLFVSDSFNRGLINMWTTHITENNPESESRGKKTSSTKTDPATNSPWMVENIPTQPQSLRSERWAGELRVAKATKIHPPCVVLCIGLRKPVLL